MPDPFTLEQTARMIGVCPATIRNWSRAGRLGLAAGPALSFTAKEVLRLKRQIADPSSACLKSRANKSAGALSLIPGEYSGRLDRRSDLARAVAFVRERALSGEAVIFMAAVRLLESAGEMAQSGHGHAFAPDNYQCAGRGVWTRIMRPWRDSLQLAGRHAEYNELFGLLRPRGHHDYLGLLHQSLASQGRKSCLGSYYTPPDMVAASIAALGGPVASFMDPCCGSGAYLRAAARGLALPLSALRGFDADRLAVNICRINLLLDFPQADCLPAVHQADFLALADAHQGGNKDNASWNMAFDAIAANPPWGARINGGTKGRLEGRIPSDESFALFLESSLRLLRPGGRLSFLLPEAVLNVKAHAGIRKLLAEKTVIKTIALLGRRFSGVFTPVVRLDLLKKEPENNSMTAIEGAGKISYVPQKYFRGNADCRFVVGAAASDRNLLAKIYAVPHVTLQGRATWGLGIVTENNRKYVSPGPQGGSEPVFRGRDVRPYGLDAPSAYINFKAHRPFFQQVAPDRLYRAAHKLIYRFIADKLVFAYDDQQRLTLNSANIVIPDLPGLSVKVCLAFLNSALFQYIHKMQFATCKVLRRDLETLPFPLLQPRQHDLLEGHVQAALSGRAQAEKLDELVFSAFRLNDREIDALMEALSGRHIGDIGARRSAARL